MNAHLTTLYDFCLGYCETLVSDIADDELTLQPAVGVNPPAWILGHLAVVSDSAVALVGGEKQLPADWHTAYGPGSDPQAASVQPSKDELLAKLGETHATLKAALADVDLESLDMPNPIAFLTKTLPTAGDLLAHIVSTHFAMHLGHLSNWRRQTGRPALF